VVQSDLEMCDADLTKFAANGAAPLPVADTEGFVEHDGAKIWYATYGAGPAVILLHGGLGVRPKAKKPPRTAAELRSFDWPRGAARAWLEAFRPPL